MDMDNALQKLKESDAPREEIEKILNTTLMVVPESERDRIREKFWKEYEGEE